MYRPVIKPAFPAVVSDKPICCKEAAKKSTHPRIAPGRKILLGTVLFLLSYDMIFLVSY